MSSGTEDPTGKWQSGPQVPHYGGVGGEIGRREREEEPLLLPGLAAGFLHIQGGEWGERLDFLFPYTTLLHLVTETLNVGFQEN